MLTLTVDVLQSSRFMAQPPLQKVAFVFSGFNERTSFIFVAKNTRFFV